MLHKIFTGAQIAAVCNEAAMIAARDLNEEIRMEHFDQAMDRVRSGLKKRTPLNPDSKKVAAFHDAGHAIAGWFMKGITAPPTKVNYSTVTFILHLQSSICIIKIYITVECYAKRQWKNNLFLAAS